MTLRISNFVATCEEAKIDYIIGVPDSYLVPLIESVLARGSIPYIAACREEECLGIASGLSMSGKRALVLMQNVGFMNAVGCFSTLCLNYRTPFLIIVANRGNLFDKTRYDVQKYRYFNKILDTLSVFYASSRSFQDQENLIALCYERSVTASEPAFLLLDEPPV